MLRERERVSARVRQVSAAVAEGAEQTRLGCATHAHRWRSKWQAQRARERKRVSVQERKAESATHTHTDSQTEMATGYWRSPGFALSGSCFTVVVAVVVGAHNLPFASLIIYLRCTVA